MAPASALLHRSAWCPTPALRNTGEKSTLGLTVGGSFTLQHASETNRNSVFFVSP